MGIILDSYLFLMPQIQPSAKFCRFHFLNICDSLSPVSLQLCYSGLITSPWTLPPQVFSRCFIARENSLNCRSAYATPQFKVLNVTYKIRPFTIGPLSYPLSISPEHSSLNHTFFFFCLCLKKKKSFFKTFFKT